MKKLIPVLIYLPLILLSCSGKPKGKEIKGKLKNASEGTMVYIELITPSAVETKDSAKLSSDGTFSFTNPATYSTFLRLKTNKPNNFLTLVSDSTESITIEADANALGNSPVINGSKGSAAYSELNMYLTKSYGRRDSLERVFQSAPANVNKEQLMKDLQEEYNRLMKEQYEYVREFVKKNSNSVVALAAIEQLDADKEFQVYQQLDKELGQKMPDNPFYKEFHTRVQEMSKLAVGSVPPEIIMNNPEGKPMKLSDLKGKVVLVDFWASWCRPCRAENPNVVKIYQANKDKGFTVFSVSLDQSKDAWIKAIKDDRLEWPNHVSELAYWNTSVVKTYNIKGIPLTYLLDKEGKIAAKGLRGEELGQKIAELLAK